MAEIDYSEVTDRIEAIYNSSTDEEKEVLRQVLTEIAEDGYSQTYQDIWLTDYKEIPVDIDTFLENDNYLGNATREGQSIFPYWRKVLHEIFDAGNKYSEVVFTGATRTGKTSTAITALAYMLYKLMCLRDPQKFFNKKDISTFSILFFNVTKSLAQGVAFKEFNTTLRSSPWFNAHGHFTDSEVNYYYIPEGGKISIDFGSSATHGLGKQIYCAIMDEVNFASAGVKDINKAKRDMKDTYDTLTARIQGTFRHGGEVFGKMFAVSSKNSDSSFLEDHLLLQKNSGADEHTYISDAPQWEVLPPDTFSGDTFYLAVGDSHNKGFVVPDEEAFPEALEDLKQQGYTIMQPPRDMRAAFIADYDIALRDLAGISVVGSMSYITQEAIDSCIDDERRNPFYNDILSIGTKDTKTIEEFFHEEEVPKSIKKSPIFIHLDLSLNDDKTGIGATAITGNKDIETDAGKLIPQPVYSHVFSVSIEAPRGDKIPYAKITAFIVWLRKQGFNIRGISRDQFQSEYMGQLLEAQGFEVKKISLDRTPDGYNALRSIILEQRIKLLRVRTLERELTLLERDSFSGKVDHPVSGCFTGDTQVMVLEDGESKSVTIQELVKKTKKKVFFALTINEETGECETKWIKKAFCTKWVKRLLRVTLSTGDIIECTPEHRFMLKDNSFREAQELVQNTELKAIYGIDISVKDTEIIETKAQPVYDLEIEGNHNFALNVGVYVHNSKDMADGLCGSVWNAVQTLPNYKPEAARKAANVIANINGKRETQSDIEKLFRNPYNPTGF